MAKAARLLGCVVLCCGCVGCATQRHLDLSARTGGSAFLFGQFQAFDGDSGRPLRFADVVRRCRGADVVLLGEQHGDAVCNQLEAQLFHALLETGRPLALAMEFFEADTQPTLDAYLTGKLDEPAFLEQSKRPSSYLNTHRPLIELSRAARVPVIAANAPRRLVREYRKSGLEYQEYRAGLDPQDRRWLPVTSEQLEGPYRDRFAAIMSGHGEAGRPASRPTSQPDSQPTSQSATQPTATEQLPTHTAPGTTTTSQPVSQPVSQPTTQPAAETPASRPTSMPASPTWQELFRSQLLWDDAMAESVANFRERYPRFRALLVVGGFHVTHEGGTFLKLRQRRPHDEILTIVYRDNPDGQFAFQDEDRGAGDIVIYGLKPPKPKKKAVPAKKPETPPAESQPTTAPATTPCSLPTTAPATMPAPGPTTAPAGAS